MSEGYDGRQYVGIDLHRKRSHIAALDEQGTELPPGEVGGVRARAWERRAREAEPQAHEHEPHGGDVQTGYTGHEPPAPLVSAPYNPWRRSDQERL